ITVNFVSRDNHVDNTTLPRSDSTVNTTRSKKIKTTRLTEVNDQTPIQRSQCCTYCTKFIPLFNKSYVNDNLKQYTMCPYCEDIYCNKLCQKNDWILHKQNCHLSYIYSCCGYILRLIKSNSYFLIRLSALARSGYLTSGRGAVTLYFDNMQEVESYVNYNTKYNRLMSVYWPLNTNSNKSTKNLRPIESERLNELCLMYEPQKEFICHVSINTVNYKLVDINLQQYHQSNNSTLLLTSLYENSNGTDITTIRQAYFANLQIELRKRGIEVEEHYPELYEKLCEYISSTETYQHFTPICLFMRHHYSKQLFMCVIMPDSDLDRSWLIDRCLLNQLNICDS
ncbi:unnamed protein product, partial [Didymodactylos carnosus]